MIGHNFLKYLTENCPSNLTFIKSLKFNRRSITIELPEDEKGFIFNDFFTRTVLYELIIAYLSNYIQDRGLNHPHDKDYLKYKFEKLIFKWS